MASEEWILLEVTKFEIAKDEDMQIVAVEFIWRLDELEDSDEEFVCTLDALGICNMLEETEVEFVCSHEEFVVGRIDSETEDAEADFEFTHDALEFVIIVVETEDEEENFEVFDFGSINEARRAPPIGWGTQASDELERDSFPNTTAKLYRTNTFRIRVCRSQQSGKRFLDIRDAIAEYKLE